MKIIQITSATSGTVTVNNTGQDVLLIHDVAGLTAALTLAMPASPVDGQEFAVCSASGITLLTINLSGGQSLVPGLSSLSVGGTSTWVYSSVKNKWYKVR